MIKHLNLKVLFNARLESIWINSSNNDVWMRQFNQWKYLGKHETGKAFCDYEFFKINHKNDLSMKALREMREKR